MAGLSGLFISISPALLSVAARAQPTPRVRHDSHRTDMPDPAVSDVDPLRTSQRRSRFGRALQVTRPGDLSSQAPTGWVDGGVDAPTEFLDRRFRFDTQGFRAYTNDPSYLVAADGELAIDLQPDEERFVVPLIPPDTVFDLTPTYVAEAQATEARLRELGLHDLEPPTNLIVPTPLDGRIDAEAYEKPGVFPADTPLAEFEAFERQLRQRWARAESPVELINRVEAERRAADEALE